MEAKVHYRIYKNQPFAPVLSKIIKVNVLPIPF